MVDNNFQPMDFGEVFANTFTVVRRTFSRAGIIVFLVLLAGGLIFAVSNMNYVEGLYKVLPKYVGIDLETDTKAKQEMGKEVFGVAAPFFLGLMGYLLCSLVGQTITTVASWEGVNNHPVETGPLLKRSLGRVFFYNFVQTMTLGAVIILVFLIAGVISFVSGQGGGISTVVSVAAAIVVFIVVLLTIFRVQEVDVDERGPFRGMISAIALFRTNKWRATAPILMFGLAYLAIAVLLSFIVTGDVSTMMGMGNTSGQDMEVVVAALTKAKAAMTWRYFLPKALIDGFAYLFLFNLITVVYTDLRIRRGDYIRGEELEEWEREV